MRDNDKHRPEHGMLSVKAEELHEHREHRIREDEMKNRHDRELFLGTESQFEGK